MRSSAGLRLSYTKVTPKMAGFEPLSTSARVKPMAAAWLRGAVCAVVVLASATLAQGAYLDPPLVVPGLAAFAPQVEFDHEVVAPPVIAGTPSPHGGAWFVPFAPNYALEPPWTTVVDVGIRDGPDWRLTLRDHASVDVRVLWVTEQLLLVEVWWGRTVSSEILIDAHRAEPVHATTYAWYGAVDADAEDGPP